VENDGARAGLVGEVVALLLCDVQRNGRMQDPWLLQVRVSCACLCMWDTRGSASSPPGAAASVEGPCDGAYGCWVDTLDVGLMGLCVCVWVRRISLRTRGWRRR
jgi:hypothetical protein